MGSALWTNFLVLPSCRMLSLPSPTSSRAPAVKKPQKTIRRAWAVMSTKPPQPAVRYGLAPSLEDAQFAVADFEPGAGSEKAAKDNPPGMGGDVDETTTAGRQIRFGTQLG